jgi:hypothetical protein
MRAPRGAAAAALALLVVTGASAAGVPPVRLRVTASPVGLDQDVVVSVAGVVPGRPFAAEVRVVSTFMPGLCVERQRAVARSGRAGRVRLRLARHDRFGLWCQSSAYRGVVRSAPADGVVARFAFQVERVG